MAQEHIEVVLRNLDAWHRGDLDAWLAMAHPEVEWYSEVARRVEGSEVVYRGHDGLRGYWDEWRSVWDVDVEVEETRDLGDRVLVLGRVHAQGEASGVGLEGPIAFLFELEDGLIRRGRAYFDTDQALRDAGPGESFVP
jgi:ketosteroid isomerase-like protein